MPVVQCPTCLMPLRVGSVHSRSSVSCPQCHTRFSPFAARPVKTASSGRIPPSSADAGPVVGALNDDESETFPAGGSESQAGLWAQIKKPALVVGLTLAAVASVIGGGYAAYKAVRLYADNKEVVHGGVLALFAAVAIGLLYFLPSVVAVMRKHHNASPILVLNLSLALMPLMLFPFVNFAVFAWIALLAWSVSATPVPMTLRDASRRAKW